MKRYQVLGIISISLSLLLHVLLFVILFYPPTHLEEEVKRASYISANLIIGKTPIEKENQAQQESNAPEVKHPQNKEMNLDRGVTSVSTINDNGVEKTITKNKEIVGKSIIAPRLPSISNTPISKEKSSSYNVEEIPFETVSKGIYLPPPLYPARAIDEGAEGEVIVELLIGRSGNVSNITILTSSGHSILDDSCITTIQSKWAFSPHNTIRKTIKRFVFSLQ